MNPASVMKLVTTAAALDVLGAAYTWRTPVWADGAVRDGVLHGNLYIQGRGDPKLVVERLWLLLQQVRQAGIDSIEGDLVLDNSAFELPPHDAARFDGAPLRAYTPRLMRCWSISNRCCWALCPMQQRAWPG